MALAPRLLPSPLGIRGIHDDGDVGFLQLVWASLLGIVAFGEALDPFVFAGGGIIVAAATYISHREAIAARRPRTPPAVATKM